MLLRNPAFTFPAPGTLKNTNTIEDFKAIDKTLLFQSVVQQVRATGADIFAVESMKALKKKLALLLAVERYYFWPCG